MKNQNSDREKVTNIQELKLSRVHLKLTLGVCKRENN